MFASDIVLMSESAFLQPYYVEVGFAPDGGWTALLPDHVGPTRAVEIQTLNRRIGPAEAQTLGLVTRSVPDAHLGQAVTETVAVLRSNESASLSATRRLIWDDRRRATVTVRLEAERAAFVAMVDRCEVIERMQAFVARRTATACPQATQRRACSS
jgi:2-(1,2-epoxy-1,2-dihydrophenyl)acetyl-CoA isomerase